MNTTQMAHELIFPANYISQFSTKLEIYFSQVLLSIAPLPLLQCSGFRMHLSVLTPTDQGHHLHGHQQIILFHGLWQTCTLLINGKHVSF